MENCTSELNDWCLSTTTALQKIFSPNIAENSETSSQDTETYLEYQKFYNALILLASQEQSNKPHKILPSWLVSNRAQHQPVGVQEKLLSEIGYKANEIDGWEKILQPAKTDLCKLLKDMIDNQRKPSVQIQIGKVTFNCHLMVLQCYSDFFMECNNEILIKLPEEKVTPSAFIMVYEWMLSSQPLIQREGILELFNAAKFLRIEQLVNQCWLCLDDDVRFCEDTAFFLYLEARNYGMEDLQQLMLMRICKFFLTLVASREFLTLNAPEVCALLSSNTIGVNSEIEMFMSAVRWLNHNRLERERHMLDVIKNVRFGLMPPLFLQSLKKNIDGIEIGWIVKHEEVKKMIDEGITYTDIQVHLANHQEFLPLLKGFQLAVPMQRQWVYDRECKHHHHFECPNMQNINYRSFLEYLEMIRSIGKDYWRSLEVNRGAEKPRQCCVCTKS